MQACEACGHRAVLRSLKLRLVARHARIVRRDGRAEDRGDDSFAELVEAARPLLDWLAAAGGADLRAVSIDFERRVLRATRWDGTKVVAQRVDGDEFARSVVPRCTALARAATRRGP